MRVFGIAGFKNAGKTTLMVELVQEFVRRGLRVATIKHAHHAFDIDHPGKDSFQHRQAGAQQVIVASAKRWAQITELEEGREPSLSELLDRIDDVDLVLVEGYKRDHHPRLELRRDGREAPELAGTDAGICAIVADKDIAAAPVPVILRSNLAAIADLVFEHARSPSEFNQAGLAGQRSG
jgi:molybdopterin-guanine dinucleotide biosynthesis protein B